MSTIVRTGSKTHFPKEFLLTTIRVQLCQNLITLKLIKAECLTGVEDSEIVKLVVAKFLLRG
jgi:hypothetical protein